MKDDESLAVELCRVAELSARSARICTNSGHSDMARFWSDQSRSAAFHAYEAYRLEKTGGSFVKVSAVPYGWDKV